MQHTGFMFALAVGTLGLALAARAGEEEGAIQLAKFEKQYRTLEQRKAHAAAVRKGILRGANLDPLPARNPLNPIIHSKREHNGYSVENVAFESLPGFFVTGNLYRPLGKAGKHPAILNPHGHFNDEKLGVGRLRPDMQARCAWFAKMGAVAFAYDMVGYAESTQTTHDDPNVLTLQLWNSIRSLDFLETLPDVDMSRVAITGASGGGTQSFLAAAVDDRITVAAPVVMVSASFFGGCKCESGMPIHRDPETNNCDIAASLAPRPLLLVSCGGDWTRTNPTVEFPYIWRVYKLFGAEANVENSHFPHEVHDYGNTKRVPVYEFFARHLGLERLPLPVAKDVWPPREDVTIEPPETLHVFNAAHPRPASALAGAEAIGRALAAARGK